MEGVPVSTLDLVIAGCKIDLEGNAHQERALQGLEAEEFMIDLGDESPQVKAPQVRPPRKNGTSAAKGATSPQATPWTTRTKRQDTGSPGEDIPRKKTKISLFLGAAKRLTHSRGASVIIRMTREGACPPMLKHMMERVILMTT